MHSLIMISAAAGKMLSMAQYNDHWWGEISKKVKRSVVFIDEPSVECLHWHGGLTLLKEALAVKDLSSFESGEETQKKAVFIVNGPVVNLAADIIGDVIRCSSFDYCIIITNASPAVHRSAKYPGVGGRDAADEGKVFVELEDEVLGWMGNPNYTCEIFHFPFNSASPCPEFYVMPAFSRLFPPLGVDLARAGELFAARIGSGQTPPPQPPSSADTVDEIVIGSLPYELQVSISHFTTSFHSVFQMLNVKEDIFTVGPFSRLLGEQLELLPSARNRRKTAANRVSLILVDRTLDLAGPTSAKQETILDKIKTVLPQFPGHVNDVQVDMAPMFGFGSEVTAKEEFPAGCLATFGPKTDKPDDTLSKFITENEQEVLEELYVKLCRASQVEKFTLPDKAIGLQDVGKALDAFRCNEDLIRDNIDLIQGARAVVTSCSVTKSIRHLQETQTRFTKLFSGKMKDVRSFLVHVTKMVRSRRERGLSLQDLLSLVAHLYALLPPGEEFYPEDEDRLQSALSEAIVKDKDDLGPTLQGLAKEDPIDEILAFEMVKKIFQKLNSVRKARGSLKEYQGLIRDGVYAGLLSRLVDDVFADDRRDVADLVHRTGGLGGLLKSGIGLFGVSVSKMHPRENPCLWIFVVGGVTAREVREVRRLVGAKSQCQFVVGSTKLLSPAEVMGSLFNQDPLLVE